MAGIITLKLSVMKSGMKDLDMKSPLFLPGPVEPHYGPGRYLTFEGFSVDEKGVQHYMDATVAYRQATLRCIEYLRRFGKWELFDMCKGECNGSLDKKAYPGTNASGLLYPTSHCNFCCRSLTWERTDVVHRIFGLSGLSHAELCSYSRTCGRLGRRKSRIS